MGRMTEKASTRRRQKSTHRNYSWVQPGNMPSPQTGQEEEHHPFPAITAQIVH
jgi:hypothetical protein